MTNFILKIFRLKLPIQLVLLCLQFSIFAQTNNKQKSIKEKFSEKFIHDALHLYDWHEVERELAKQTGASEAECNEFFRYLGYKGELNFNEYLEEVQRGNITQSNALQYWMSKMSMYVFKFNRLKTEVDNYQQETNQSFKTYTGGAICNNLDFSDGTTNGWSGKWNNTKNDQWGTLPTALPAVGLNSSGTNTVRFVHQLCTPGADPNVPAVQRVPPGHTISLRLGDDEPYTSTSFNFPFNHQMIENSFTVTPQNNSIVYWYSVLFHQAISDPHGTNEQPYFKIRMFDQSGAEILCAHYDVNIASGTISGFKNYSLGSSDEAVYKDWTQVMIPLINYIGQKVTIRFESSDCSAGGHFGYAYLAVDCGPFSVIQATPFPCNPGGTATLNAPSGAATYNWTGPGIVGASNNQLVTINAPGPYSVTMTTLGNSGAVCTFKIDTVLSQSINVPVAAFSTNSPCLGLPTVFTDASTGNGISSWSWNFGDGSQPSTAQNPTHTYAAANTYNVTLIIKNAAGCGDTVVMPITINPLPLAQFTVNSPCVGTSAQITDASTGNNLSYTWDFGDNTSAATGQSPIHTYASANTYTISLVVSTAAGCKDTVKNIIKVNPLPVPSFTAAAQCVGSITNFTNTSTSAGSSTYSWDFGNGIGTSALQNPTYTYPLAGTFNAQLTVKDSLGCINKVAVPVNVYDFPKPMFTAPPVCDGAVTVFNNQTPSSPVIGSWEWDFTNNASVDNTTPNPTNTYAVGTYTALLTASTATIPACKASYSTQVVVNPNPVPNFNSTIVCMGALTVFDNSATTIALPDNISSYNWTFGDQTTSSGSNPQHLYNSCGQFGVTMEAVSNHGCKIKVTNNAFVNCNPLVSFTAPGVCLNQSTVFTNNSSISIGNIITYNWDFNQDGTIDNTTLNPSTTYPIAGTYTVTLIAISDSACVSSQSIPVDVYPLPVAKFTHTSACTGTPVNFTDASVVAIGSVTSWTWDFDNNTTVDNTVQNPAYTYNTGGIQQVHLQVASNNGCKDDTLIPMYINLNPVPTITVDDPDGCPAHTANLSGGVLVSSISHPNSIVKWVWDINTDGTNDVVHIGPGKETDQVNNTIYNNGSYSDLANYAVTLTITSDSGCVGKLTTPSNFIRVFPRPIAGFTWDPTDPKPDELEPTVYFYSSALGATSMNWNFGDNYLPNAATNTSTSFSPIHTYEYWTVGTHNVWQWVSNTYGCKDSVMNPVEIIHAWTFYIPNAFTPTGDGINDGFKGTGYNIYNYNIWIYDRWGNMIFSTNEMDEVWDGRLNGTKVQEDVYVWKVKFKDVFGKNHERNGTVTVVR